MIINSEETNQKAIDRVLSLLDDYEGNLKEIDKLVAQIETYEATAPELEEFSKKNTVIIQCFHSNLQIKYHNF